MQGNTETRIEYGRQNLSQSEISVRVCDGSSLWSRASRNISFYRSRFRKKRFGAIYLKKVPVLTVQCYFMDLIISIIFQVSDAHFRDA